MLTYVREGERRIERGVGVREREERGGGSERERDCGYRRVEDKRGRAIVRELEKVNDFFLFYATLQRCVCISSLSNRGTTLLLLRTYHYHPHPPHLTMARRKTVRTVPSFSRPEFVDLAIAAPRSTLGLCLAQHC